MALTTGTHLGPYEIVSPLGAGGMGEVYHARDTRLHRSVAIKILPAPLSTDPDRLRRFEAEAKVLSALSHPNLLGIFDVGAQDGLHFLVAELLEGETLRQKLTEEKIPPRKVAAYAIQMAHGLAAAHEKGVVHRDLKPENIFITNDGRVKILDFGLAKQDAPNLHSAPHHKDATVTLVTPTPSAVTEPGAVMGTVGYMSPEQVRGRAVDARSDIFSFGAILYEMMTGERAFHGDSAVETMSAILKEDPPEISAADPNVSTSMDKLVRRCLEKNPEERFQSARDLGFALEAVSGSSKTSGAKTLTDSAAPGTGTNLAAAAATATANETAAASSRTNKITLPRLAVLVWAVLTVAALALVAWFFLQPLAPLNPQFEQLTFQRGAILNARFTPSADTILYAASWQGDPFQIYTARLSSRESHALGVQGLLEGVSAKGDVAVIVRDHLLDRMANLGTLATVPLDGGTPREVLNDVTAADISADGSKFAVVRVLGGQRRLEFPIGHLVSQTNSGSYSHPRISPDGTMLAFDEHPVAGDDRGFVDLLDRDGNVRRLTPEWGSLQSLAWNKSGTEIWFSAAGERSKRSIRAVSLDGKNLRLIREETGDLSVDDVSSDGRLLVDAIDEAYQLMVTRPGQPDKDFSYLDLSVQPLIAPDGRSIIFTEAAFADEYATIIRKLDGSPAVRLGPGFATSVSNDGKWVLSESPSQPTHLQLFPTGVGEPRSLELTGLVYGLLESDWMSLARGFNDKPPSQPAAEPRRSTASEESDPGFYFVAAEPGHPPRTWRLLLDTPKPQPVTPEGLAGALISPDGKKLVVRDAQGNPSLFDLATNQDVPLKGIRPGEKCLNWDETGTGLYVTSSHVYPFQIDHLNVTTGARTPWRTLTTGDPAGVAYVTVALPRQGEPIAHAVRRFRSTLFLVSSLH